MRQAARVFEEAATDLEQELRRVHSMVASLRASWTGASCDDLVTALDTWEASLRAVIDRLTHLSHVTES
jgi:WXG100 family type VII secretion target